MDKVAWDRLSKISKKDLVVQLYTGLQETRAQGGGDPALARLVIEDEDGAEETKSSTPRKNTGPVRVTGL